MKTIHRDGLYAAGSDDTPDEVLLKSIAARRCGVPTIGALVSSDGRRGQIVAIDNQRQPDTRIRWDDGAINWTRQWEWL